MDLYFEETVEIAISDFETRCGEAHHNSSCSLCVDMMNFKREGCNKFIRKSICIEGKTISSTKWEKVNSLIYFKELKRSLDLNKELIPPLWYSKIPNYRIPHSSIMKDVEEYSNPMFFIGIRFTMKNKRYISFPGDGKYIIVDDYIYDKFKYVCELSLEKNTLLEEACYIYDDTDFSQEIIPSCEKEAKEADDALKALINEIESR